MNDDQGIISCEKVLRWISSNFHDDKSTLVQVMAWCLQATSHYLCQRWPRRMALYEVIRPQWGEVPNLNSTWKFNQYICHVYVMYVYYCTEYSVHFISWFCPPRRRTAFAPEVTYSSRPVALGANLLETERQGSVVPLSRSLGPVSRNHWPTTGWLHSNTFTMFKFSSWILLCQ